MGEPAVVLRSLDMYVNWAVLAATEKGVAG